MQVAEASLDDDARQVALLGAVEAGQVALQEGGEAGAAAGDVIGGQRGVGEQGLGLGVFEQGHGGPSGPGQRAA
jgi:hypothetical protein